MATIYTGTVPQAQGRSVIWQDTCRCDAWASQAIEFRCAKYGGFTEYTWTQCPHQAPTPRVNLAVPGAGGNMIHLTHARTNLNPRNTHRRYAPALVRHTNSRLDNID